MHGWIIDEEGWAPKVVLKVPGAYDQMHIQGGGGHHQYRLKKKIYIKDVGKSNKLNIHITHSNIWLSKTTVVK